MVTDQYEITRLEIAKLELKDGDVLAVRILNDYPMNEIDLAHIKDHLASVLPAGVKTLIFNQRDVELKVISKNT